MVLISYGLGMGTHLYTYLQTKQIRSVVLSVPGVFFIALHIEILILGAIFVHF